MKAERPSEIYLHSACFYLLSFLLSSFHPLSILLLFLLNLFPAYSLLLLLNRLPPSWLTHTACNIKSSHLPILNSEDLQLSSDSSFHSHSSCTSDNIKCNNGVDCNLYNIKYNNDVNCNINNINCNIINIYYNNNIKYNNKIKYNINNNSNGNNRELATSTVSEQFPFKVQTGRLFQKAKRRPSSSASPAPQRCLSKSAATITSLVLLHPSENSLLQHPTLPDTPATPS